MFNKNTSWESNAHLISWLYCLNLIGGRFFCSPTPLTQSRFEWWNHTSDITVWSCALMSFKKVNKMLRGEAAWAVFNLATVVENRSHISQNSLEVDVPDLFITWGPIIDHDEAPFPPTPQVPGPIYVELLFDATGSQSRPDGPPFLFLNNSQLALLFQSITVYIVPKGWQLSKETESPRWERAERCTNKRSEPEIRCQTNR